MGKSWLLTELARRLGTEHDPPHLVGFAESFGETPDLLLRAVVDLYARWLADAGCWQQAKKVWQNEKANLLPSFAKTVAKIFGEIADPAVKGVAVVVEEAITGLLAADERLRTGGLQLPTLSYQQARDLVGSVAQVSGRPIALFLDQWEKSPDVSLESKTLDSFLRHRDDWPGCHFFVALRPDQPAFDTVRRLAASLPGPATLYDLEGMDLDEEAEQRRLVGYVRRTVPATGDVDAQFLLERIDRFPGVLGRWNTAIEYDREHMQTRADLERVAADAFAYRYSELHESLNKLDSDQRRVAMRLALLPLSDQIWPVLRKEWLGDLSEDLIDDLALANVLESRKPPGFGHGKRWEAARAWFVEHRRAATRTEAEALILRLATPVHVVESGVVPNLLALWSLRLTSGELELSAVAKALCELVGLGLDAQIQPKILISGAQQARAPRFAAIAPLLAIGLVYGLIPAKAEDDLARRDALLEELRALAGAHPEDAAVRERLAPGLAKTMLDAADEEQPERLVKLREELGALADAHPDDGWVERFRSAGLL